MKSKFILPIFLLSRLLIAQDTIPISKKMTLMIFPDEISDFFLDDTLEFVIKSNTNNGGQYSTRILKLNVNLDSNKKNVYSSMIVITQNGNSYEFVLKSVNEKTKPSWYINPNQAVTNINNTRVIDETTLLNFEEKKQEKLSNNNDDEKDTGPVPKPTEELYRKNRDEYYRRKCYYNQFNKPVIARIGENYGKVYLWLSGVYYNFEEIYMQFKIENRGSIDYDIDFLDFEISVDPKETGLKQNTVLQPVYKYKIPKKVKGNSENYFIVVFKKFPLSKKRSLITFLEEKNGQRNITLSIAKYYINNPKNF